MTGIPTGSCAGRANTPVDGGMNGGILDIQNVNGGSGPGGYNILVGNGGNILTGGNGRRNLLIAGVTASQLFGGNDDDILIGGTTAYDKEAGLVSLQAIMAYWTGGDLYATRVANLSSGRPWAAGADFSSRSPPGHGKALVTRKMWRIDGASSVASWKEPAVGDRH
jgi:hypothetical protein